MYLGSSKLKWLLALSLLGAVACGTDDSDPSPNDEFTDDPILTNVDVLQQGWPGNGALANEDKADQNFQPRFVDLVATQSPVKSQGGRGVCSIFASTAYIEHLYISAGEANPDFSEQYLQWSSKFLEGAFPNTGGSNNQSNLDAVHNYGTIVESAWPYESRGWTSADDAECGGEEGSLPIKCFTNGDAPQSAKDSQKYFIPSARWHSSKVRSVKATMFNKKQAVPVGLTFFYQSWNHGRSALPVNSEYSKKGYVLYPNAKDKELSLVKRAGHAILLVGWDDTLEVTQMDAEGKPVLDASGNPVKEKGFFLFKNSWGKGSFGSQNPEGDGYGWLSYKYVEEYGSSAVSDLPKLTAPTEICGDGADNDNNGSADCDDSVCANHATCVNGSELIELDLTAGNEIPDNNPEGLAVDFTVEGPGEVTALGVMIEITHSYIGDLKILLEGPDGTVATLKRSDSNSADDLSEVYIVEDFNGKSGEGIWTLRVVDTANSDEGVLKSATIELTR